MTNLFQQSEDMESDAWQDYGSERIGNPFPLANPHRLPYGSDEQKEAIAALENHTQKQADISARLHKRLKLASQQRDSETVNAMALGCVGSFAIAIVLPFLIWFSSKYPGWNDVLMLIESLK